MINVGARAARGLLVISFCVSFWRPGTASAEDFYKGKTISIDVSGSGSYEAYARLMARYMPKYIPGAPNIIVKLMTGASGLRATNYIYNVAPKDGTEIAGVHGQIPTQPLFNKEGVQYDPNKLSWIGSATKETYIAYMWHTSPVQSMDDARVKQSIVGGQAIGSMSIDIPVLANAMMGTKFKIVTGYKGSAETRLAVERGELDGHVGTAYTSITSENPDWLRDKKIKIIAQFGAHRHAAMPDVPLLIDYVINPEDKQAMTLFLARQETGKPYFGPPGMPADRLALLRHAFDETVHDPEYLKEIAAAKLETTEPMTGAEIEEFVAHMYQLPPSAGARISAAIRKYTSNGAK